MITLNRTQIILSMLALCACPAVLSMENTSTQAPAPMSIEQQAPIVSTVTEQLPVIISTEKAITAQQQEAPVVAEMPEQNVTPLEATNKLLKSLYGPDYKYTRRALATGALFALAAPNVTATLAWTIPPLYVGYKAAQATGKFTARTARKMAAFSEKNLPKTHFFVKTMGQDIRDLGRQGFCAATCLATIAKTKIKETSNAYGQRLSTAWKTRFPDMVTRFPIRIK